ncbi:MAG: hypothetical protein PHU27_06475 [Salinivirgaceae bacterium]|nr:hypothetical protein [Salinivirgaceae bacterium]MDD4746609.1 hypothetical protein [Salinivirgaceae bacterium]
MKTIKFQNKPMKKIDWDKVVREIEDIRFSKSETRDKLVKIVWFIFAISFMIFMFYKNK